MKKKIVLVLIILFLPSVIFSEINDQVKVNLNQSIDKQKAKEVDKVKNSSKKFGPTGKPYVKGPNSNPPTNEEVLKMRGVVVQSEDPSFWTKIWNWITSLFN